MGKRHLRSEEEFLRQHYKSMPRTMLRYAIERFSQVQVAGAFRKGDRAQIAVQREGPVLNSATILKGITTTTSVINTLRSLIKGTKGAKRGLLIELQSNIRLILLYVEGGAPIDKVIRKLDVSRCKAALESDFNFSSLKRGCVSRAAARDVAQYEAYVGWTTEQLFSNIYLKIRDLQNIVDIDPSNKKFRTSVRLLNVLKLMILLLRHLKS